MKSSIRTQLLLVNTLVLLIIFIGMSVFLVTTSTSTLRDRLKNEVRSFAALATPPIGDTYSIYGQSGTDKIKEELRTYLKENDSVVNVTIVNVLGETLYSYNADEQPAVTVQQAASFDPIFESESGNLTHVIYPYIGASGAHTYSVVYSISNKAINDAVKKEAFSLMAFIVLSLAATSAITFSAINYFVLRPVRKVSEQADIISAGNLEQQIVVSGTNEIAHLGQAVNAMAESLKANIAKLQEIDKVKSEFMAITSHNLRTPLTIINGYLDTIGTKNTVDDLKHVIERITESVTRLDEFAEDVLTISRYELGEHNSIKELVAVDDIVQKIINDTKAIAESHGLSVTSELQSGSTINISRPHFRVAVQNIVDNAIKFTSKDGTINIKTFQQGNEVCVQVSDNGIGIKVDEIPKLFTKFHRGTSVTTYNYEGTGIGLYASKIIIEEAGGHITVDSTEGKGSTFTVILPIAKNTDKADTIGSNT